MPGGGAVWSSVSSEQPASKRKQTKEKLHRNISPRGMIKIFIKQRLMLSVSICEKLSPLQPRICGQLLNLIFPQLVVSFPCAWTAIKTESSSLASLTCFSFKATEKTAISSSNPLYQWPLPSRCPSRRSILPPTSFPLLGHLLSILHQHRSWQIFRFLGLMVYSKQVDHSVIHSTSPRFRVTVPEIPCFIWHLGGPTDSVIGFRPRILAICVCWKNESFIAADAFSGSELILLLRLLAKVGLNMRYEYLDQITRCTGKY